MTSFLESAAYPRHFTASCITDLYWEERGYVHIRKALFLPHRKHGMMNIPFLIIKTCFSARFHLGLSQQIYICL